MIYKEVILKKDEHILDGLSDYKWAKLLDCSPMYVNLVRRERTIATSKFYSTLKRVRKSIDTIK